MSSSQSEIAPQVVGGAGPIPFWAAAHQVIFDGYANDSATPGSSVTDLFQGAKADVKVYPFLARHFLKVVASAGSSGGTFAADGPMNVLSIYRFKDPNGHAIIDTDGYGLWLRNKWGARHFFSQPEKMPNGSISSVNFNFALYGDFEFNTLGSGSLPNMDATGPYQTDVQLNTSAKIWTTAPSTTTPSVKITAGIEAWTLPGATSRVNGQPQNPAPPPIAERGIVLVNEFHKESHAINSGGGQQLIPVNRKGNIHRQLILVLRDSSGARTDWVASGVASGTTITYSFDTNPLLVVDPQHLIDRMMRQRSSGETYTTTDGTGVLVIDYATPHRLAMLTDAFSGGLDEMMQTAQSSDLQIDANYQSGVGSGTLEIYVDDITATGLNGQPYSFATPSGLILPVPPGTIRS